MKKQKVIICSWNINSIRARINLFKDWLKRKNPDVVLLQETKARDEDFPLEELEEFNYNIVTNGQKSYNGVAIMSKYPISDIQNKFQNNEEGLPQARYIEGWIDINSRGLRVASVYAPNGNPVHTEKYKYKLDWLNSFSKYSKNLLLMEEVTVLGGDFNICPSKFDAADESLLENDAIYRKEVRKIFNEIVYSGYYDAFRCLNENNQGFTYWDYGSAFNNNIGVRIDHFLLSSYALDKCNNIYVDIEERRKKKPSDHAPLLAEFYI